MGVSLERAGNVGESSTFRLPFPRKKKTVPIHRKFEFRPDGQVDIIYGKVSSAVENVDAINGLVGKPIMVRVLARWADNARPKYTLLEIPNGSSTSPE